ncbi:MAG: hypothetical protein JOY75_04630, partial [Hyphomicrobiales bacterium]|nr:hypothetical protein [Hyphomicrobiales bacterium]
QGDLFGTTFLGGAGGGGTVLDGTVFELINNNGSYTLNTLATFNGSNGAYPSGNLIADAKGDLFGTTGGDGYHNDGTVFELVNNKGGYTLDTLVNFSGSNGYGPSSSLIADAKGDLFGTTFSLTESHFPAEARFNQSPFCVGCGSGIRWRRDGARGAR